MPAHNITEVWSSAISIETGDVVENSSAYAFRISATGSDDNAATLPSGQSYRAETTGTVQVRGVGGSGRLIVARGL